MTSGNGSEEYIDKTFDLKNGQLRVHYSPDYRKWRWRFDRTKKKDRGDKWGCGTGLSSERSSAEKEGRYYAKHISPCMTRAEFVSLVDASLGYVGTREFCQLAYWTDSPPPMDLLDFGHDMMVKWSHGQKMIEKHREIRDKEHEAEWGEPAIADAYGRGKPIFEGELMSKGATS